MRCAVTRSDGVAHAGTVARSVRRVGRWLQAVLFRVRDGGGVQLGGLHDGHRIHRRSMPTSRPMISGMMSLPIGGALRIGGRCVGVW